MARAVNGVMTEQVKRLETERRKLRAACRAAQTYLQRDVRECEDAGVDLPDELVRVLVLLREALPNG